MAGCLACGGVGWDYRRDPPAPCPGCRTSGDMLNPGPWQEGCCVTCDRASPTLVCVYCRPEVLKGLETLVGTVMVMGPLPTAVTPGLTREEVLALMDQPSTQAALDAVPADTRTSWESR